MPIDSDTSDGLTQEATEKWCSLEYYHQELLAPGIAVHNWTKCIQLRFMESLQNGYVYIPRLSIVHIELKEKK